MSRGKELGGMYKVGERIGQGSFSNVYFCTDKSDGQRFAVKVLNKQSLRNQGMTDAFEREVMALRTVQRSPFVTNLHTILHSERNFYVVMDLAESGSLLEQVMRNRGLSQPVARRYCRQMLLGIKAIHDSGLVHRDIKPDNMLLDYYKDLKISDFGFAALSDDERVLRRQCGTPQYTAPEVVRGEGYNGRKVDIWSAGVSLYVMLCGRPPFAAFNTQQLFEKICAAQYDVPQEKNLPDTALHLLSVMMHRNPEKRWPVDKLLNHPWVLGRRSGYQRIKAVQGFKPNFTILEVSALDKTRTSQSCNSRDASMKRSGSHYSEASSSSIQLEPSPESLQNIARSHTLSHHNLTFTSLHDSFTNESFDGSVRLHQAMSLQHKPVMMPNQEPNPLFTVIPPPESPAVDISDALWLGSQSCPDLGRFTKESRDIADGLRRRATPFRQSGRAETPSKDGKEKSSTALLEEELSFPVKSQKHLVVVVMNFVLMCLLFSGITILRAFFGIRVERMRMPRPLRRLIRFLKNDERVTISDPVSSSPDSREDPRWDPTHDPKDLSAPDSNADGQWHERRTNPKPLKNSTMGTRKASEVRMVSMSPDGELLGLMTPRGMKQKFD